MFVVIVVVGWKCKQMAAPHPLAAFRSALLLPVNKPAFTTSVCIFSTLSAFHSAADRELLFTKYSLVLPQMAVISSLLNVEPLMDHLGFLSKDLNFFFVILLLKIAIALLIFLYNKQSLGFGRLNSCTF